MSKCATSSQIMQLQRRIFDKGGAKVPKETHELEIQLQLLSEYHLRDAYLRP